MSTPPPLRPDRDPGDNWAVAPDGTRYWGAFGAAGLLAHDPERGVLLQHRAPWSHHGDTWGIPGGARHQGEDALSAALRESAEEAGVPAEAVRADALHVLDRSVWTYTTVIARVTAPFEPTAADRESVALAWVPLDAVTELPLHPGFGATWPLLRESLAHRPALVVDAANVVGSVPDGWWRDRAGATARLLERLSALAHAGLPGEAWGLRLDAWFPRIVAVIEGAARAAPDAPGVEVARAEGAGDEEIVAQARVLAEAGHRVVVVSADRALRERVAAVATCRGTGWLQDALDDVTR